MQSVDQPAPAASRPSQPLVPVAAPPKLVIEKFADGGVACIRFTGTIDEGFEGKKLGQAVAADTLVLDLGGVKKISSFGIREWIDFVTSAARHAGSLILVECSPKVVDQLNMVANFAGGGRVFSLYAPFRCDYCDSEQRALLRVDRDHEAIKAGKLADRPCTSCKESMYFDEDGGAYFSYLVGQDRFELSPAVEAFLAHKLHYAVGDVQRKIRVDKVIEGRTTYLRLAGDLDGSFPRDKLAEGLEGTVIVDLGAIGQIEPVGAMQWRGFVAQVAAAAERVYLASAPLGFVEKLCTRDDLNPKIQLLTVLMPYSCTGCGTTSAHSIDVGAHYEVLKFATAPELRCAHCRHAMQCNAGEAVMTLLPTMPRPTAGPELVKSVAVLRERALLAGAPRRARTTGATPHVAPPSPRAGAWLPVVVVLLAIMVALAGYAVYLHVTAGPAARAGAVTQRSAAARPAWILGDTPAGATCGDAPRQALSCIGVSALSARQDDAEDEAADAALDALANAIAVRIASPAWKAHVVAIYAAARDAKLAAFDRDPSSTSARRDVREARHAVAQALRATAGGAVPAAPTGRYWEEYQGDGGKRYLAFAQVAIGATELARLVDGYAQTRSALGATVVGAFPLLAWRYPRLDSGAVIVQLGAGPLLELGLAEQYVVLAIAGRDVADAAAFGALAIDEYAGLAERGGTLRLKVQAGDGAPREFAAVIKPSRAASELVAPTARRAAAPELAPAAVNVWDRFGGATPGGRDDPTQ